ncbi:hypothetical protein EMCRGX_G005216 [Ephydatia muelleri]
MYCLGLLRRQHLSSDHGEELPHTSGDQRRHDVIKFVILKYEQSHSINRNCDRRDCHSNSGRSIVRSDKRRKEIIQLAGLANVIPNIEVDLTPQRTDVKSVHSADIVYSKLVFSQARVRIAEDSCRKGLEDVLDSRPMDGDQSVNEYVDETTLETELESVLCDSTATVIRPVCNELCQNEEEANNPEVQNRITGAPLMKNDLAM